MKYELTDETNGSGLRRIRALRDIPRYGVKEGDLGGWVESEGNLTQEGDCWVFDKARVSDTALISGDARVFDNAQVFGNTRVFDNAQVCDTALIYGDAQVCGNALIYGNAWVFDNALIYGDARVFGNAWVFDAAVCGGVTS